MFAEGDEVQAVIQATVDTVSLANDPADAALTLGISMATNVRCFGKPGRPAPACQSVNETITNQRANAAREAGWQEIVALGEPVRETFPTAMRVFHAPLADKIDGFEAVETIDVPLCVRAGVGDLTEIKFLNELVTREHDEWGRPRNVVRERRINVGRVTFALQTVLSDRDAVGPRVRDLEGARATPARRPGQSV